MCKELIDLFVSSVLDHIFCVMIKNKYPISLDSVPEKLEEGRLNFNVLISRLEERFVMILTIEAQIFEKSLI